MSSDNPESGSASGRAGRAPKWESDTKDRIRAAIRKYQKPLAALVDRDANEGDTRLLITEFLCTALGYDRFSDLATEYRVKGEFADFGLRIDQQLVAFVECKRATTRLGPKHLRQVSMYALNEGVEWVILTNGSDWQAYHVTVGPPGQPVSNDLTLDVSLLGPETAASKAGVLFHISREALKKRTIDEVWKARAATAPTALATAILSDPVLKALRLEVRRNTRHNCEESELAQLLRDTVIRPEALP